MRQRDGRREHTCGAPGTEGAVPATRGAAHDRRPPDRPRLFEEVAGVDLVHANPARMYDYALGGSHNFQIDREVADEVFAVMPSGPAVARSNRAFLRRAVEHCADAGIEQFLDLGSGIPTRGNTHQIAQARNPRARVIYVDNEPVAVAHTRQLLGEDDRTEVVAADIRDPAAVLDAEPVRQLLDLAQPVAVLLVAVLHYVGEGIEDVLATYRLRCAPGSRLVISHTTQDNQPVAAAEVREVLGRSGTEVIHRDRAAVRALFNGWRLVEPGVVWTPQWRAEPGLGERPADSETWCGVAELVRGS